MHPSDDSSRKAPDWQRLARENEERRKVTRASPQRLLLKNVRIFNGNEVSQPTEVAIEDGRIVANLADAEALNCNGGVLLPGLIDAHCHPTVFSQLEKMARYGITTALSMSGVTKAHMDSLKDHIGVTAVRVTGIPAAGPTNYSVKFIAGWPMDETLTDPSQAQDWVDRQLSKGAEYIKLLCDIPGMSQDILNALVSAAKKRQKLVVAHAAQCEPARQALRAGAHQLHHSPMGGVLVDADIEQYEKSQAINCPTLTAMKAFTEAGFGKNNTYANARDNVAALHKAGIPIIAGTDANEGAGSPIEIPWGTTLHEELRLLVEAGLSNAEALRAATMLPAKHFHLNDRGVISPGYRADLILVAGDPLEDIGATSKIKRVWIGGIEVPLDSD